MIAYLQETDSTSVDCTTMPIALVRNTSPDETFGKSEDAEFLDNRLGWSVLYSARTIACRAEVAGVSAAASQLLSHIEKCAFKFQKAGFDINDVPTLYAFAIEDGSLAFEWIFDDFRLGFTIEVDEKGSCWYLVTKERLGSIRASGFTQGVNLEKITEWLFHFMLVNI